MQERYCIDLIGRGIPNRSEIQFPPTQIRVPPRVDKASEKKSDITNISSGFGYLMLCQSSASDSRQICCSTSNNTDFVGRLGRQKANFVVQANEVSEVVKIIVTDRFCEHREKVKNT
eukprot:TRINITY_DN4544_c0_g1_i12.p1 TRINITY_DN4544_c0_g1~~TRINITY_DN4544_c0_g1_i12.p1  ORF type:complete len:117 (-),score=0.63 TRINITY_DN4544_c0_g1_i12:6-356(-)